MEIDQHLWHLVEILLHLRLQLCLFSKISFKTYSVYLQLVYLRTYIIFLVISIGELPPVIRTDAKISENVLLVSVQEL